ncbi:MAG: tRNA (N6-isopentenyl adenosine(37)-C2)-methylthiotransferase MiaB [Bdellovibrionales bacterium]|nr:tRNA (N6-isopentenyl adenosine(37)-C2)-methylthiotransferase MiaB [Bdellovibrionales bacterium]
MSQKRQAKSFYVKTFGCQMNVADSERMMSLLAEQGMTAAPSADQADVILINGCTVREKAVHKAVSQLGVYHHEAKGSQRAPIIGIGGCVGQLEKNALFKRAPYLDFVFGTDTIDNLPEMLSRVANGERHIVYADFDKSMDYSTETKVYGAKAQAFVNIMKGCDKYCTYCIVPFTRGKEKSRTIDEVLSDLARLVATGVREITLLGQNVNSFGKGNPNTKNRSPVELHNRIGKVGPREGEENFPMLLRAIEEDPRLSKLRWIRFTSSHPLDFSDELIECYAPPEKGGLSKLAPHLHLPVQSGSNAVLQKMGRHHKIEGYVEQMDRLREICPDVGLSTDLIVGFPTETDADFQQTLDLLDRVQYDNIYAFAYSPRPGTRAAKLQDDVPAAVKNERLNILLKRQLEIAEKRYASRIGREMELLVEGQARHQNLLHGADATNSKVWTGHTPCGRVCNFISDSPRPLIGRFVRVKITAATSLSLTGELVHDPFEAERGGDALPPLSEPISSEIVR